MLNYTFVEGIINVILFFINPRTCIKQIALFIQYLIMRIFKYNPLTAVLTCCFFLFFITKNNSASAQDTLTADGLFQIARKAAFEENNYTKAKLYCNKVLEMSPGYTDVTVFLGRLYSWSKQYDSARINFQKALNQKADYADAAVAYADMEYWADNNRIALKIIDTALVYHPQSNDLLLRKAKVQ